VIDGCVERCRACEHRTWPRERSEQQKQAWLETALGAWKPVLGAVLGSERRWGYRDKTCLRAQRSEGRWTFGTRARVAGTRREYEVVAIPRCPVHSPRVNAVLAALSEGLAPELPLCFVHVAGGILSLVLKSPKEWTLPEVLNEDAVARLARTGVSGIYLNLNPSAGERVFSSRGWRLVWGAGKGRDPEGYMHGPESFRQLLPALHRESVEAARAFLMARPGDLVLDLYSGVGASLRCWLEAGAETVGVELGGESVDCARENAPGAAVLRGRVSERIPQLREMAGGRSTLVYANPPRSGLETEVSAWLAGELRPARIAYLSCSAGTLARDLSIFTQADYVVRRILPYDFFPQTRHIEALALLELDRDRVRAADLF
jgi:tRNA/tmRNA/rRNA uracil-C5-methylase (TrmA/RlmC/RlmD family)